MAGDRFLDLGFTLGRGIRFSRDGADGDHLRNSGRENGGARIGAAGEPAEAGIDSVRKADFHLKRIVFQGAGHVRTRVAKARRGVERSARWQGLRKENPSALEIRYSSDCAVSVCDSGKALTCKSSVEFCGGFYFWKLHNGEIKLGRKCGKRLEEENKGCEANHAFGCIPAC